MSVRIEVSPARSFDLFYENGVLLGRVFPLEDGWYRFDPEDRPGVWDAHVLRAIANKLDELNAPMKRDLDLYFHRRGEMR